MKEIQIVLGKKFQKEFKKLLKKYRSLENDFNFLMKFIKETPCGDGSIHWNVLKKDKEKIIMKKRMMCRSLKSSSFRVIYYYDGEKIELEFIELYFKGSKESEDQKLIDEIWERKNAVNINESVSI